MSPDRVPIADTAKLLMAMADSSKGWLIDGAAHGIAGDLLVISVVDACLIAGEYAARARAEAVAGERRRIAAAVANVAPTDG